MSKHRFVGRSGEAYRELGLYPEARSHLERSLELFRGTRGDEDPDTLNAMRSLGYLYFADGKWAEAQTLLVPAMEGLKRVRGCDHPRYAHRDGLCRRIVH